MKNQKSFFDDKETPFDPTLVDKKWNESELSDFWMGDILKHQGWGTTSSSIRYMKKEVKSSFRDRIDFALYVGNRVVACIELKSPKSVDLNDQEKKRICLRQASKYALSKFKYHHGALVAPLGIVTNGIHAFVFDGSQRFEAVLNFHRVYNLTEEADLRQFLAIFSADNFNLEKGFSTNPILRTPIEESQRPPVNSADAQLSRDILSLFRRIETHSEVPNREVAFLGTISLFILSVFRDCGLYPNDRIQKLVAKRTRASWESMVDDLSQIMQDDLSLLKSPYCEASWDFYEDTTWLCVNLATFPATGLGRAYEDLLQTVSQKSSTSFYTPEEVINDILNTIKPGFEDKILDPTCGSAAFLATVIERTLTEHTISPREARSYIEKCIWGVDRDWFACQIARVSIIAVYAKFIQFDDESSNKFKAPKVNIHHQDFFSYSEKNQFDIIVGNPPWGSIDKEIDSVFMHDIKTYQSYKDKTDVCVYVVEKCWRHLKEKSQFGLLCKREILEGIKHENHRAMWNGRVESVWDYGKRKLFHNNGALTMVLLGRKRTTEACVKIAKNESAVRKLYEYPGTPLGNTFDIYQGYASGDDQIFRALAQKFPDSPHVRLEVADRDLDAFERREGRPTFFLNQQETLPADCRSFLEKTMFTKTVRKSKNRAVFGKGIKNSGLWFLLNRENCLRGQAYEGWSWVYRNGVNAGAIVMPRFVRGERCRAVVLMQHAATMTNLSVLQEKQGSHQNKYFVLAFLNSKSATEIIANSVKLAGSGDVVAAFPEYLKNVRVPECPDSLLHEAIAMVSFLLSSKASSQALRGEALNLFDVSFQALTVPDYAAGEKLIAVRERLQVLAKKVTFIATKTSLDRPEEAISSVEQLDARAVHVLGKLERLKAKQKASKRGRHTGTKKIPT